MQPEQENLKYNCRTCFMKLENTCLELEGSKKFVVINKYPEIIKLIHICLGKSTGDGVGDDLHYMPNMCCLCFDRWGCFAKHYQILLKSEEKLRKIVGKQWINDEANKVFIETAAVNDLCEIEKYETNSPFYQDSNQSDISSYDIHPIEELNTIEDYIDPHQNDNTPPSSPDPISKNSLNLEVKSSNAEDVRDCPNSAIRVNKQEKNSRTLSLRRRTKTSKIKRKYIKKKSLLKEERRCGSGEINTKKALYRCEPCKKYFYEIRRYEGHVKKVHEGIKKAFQCQDCDKAYKFYKNLTEHIADNHTEKPQENRKCEICKKEFKTQTTLKNHMKIKHPNPNDSEDISNSRRVICDQCGFLAASSESLAAHIKNKHTEAEQYKCEQCPKIFKCRYYLKHHITSHHNPIKIKPFNCSECDMAFSRRNGLNKHKLTHLNYSDRIKCDFEGCDVRFLNSDAKRRHTRLVHLKVKQHVCDICGEAFGIKATLRHHRYIHTGEKPYKCNFCGQAFRQHTAMKTHSKTHFTKSSGSKSLDVLTSVSKTNVNLENNLNIF